MRTRITVLVLCLFSFCSLSGWAQEIGAKKLIYYGWGIPESQYVREHWREMEKIPFDGTGIIVAVDRQTWQQGKKETSNQLGWEVMGKRAFAVDEFREAMADLSAAHWQTMTDNFLPVVLSGYTAAGVNWFDDERWRTIVNNFSVVGKIAAAGKLKGLIFDPEAYSNVLIFSYIEQQKQVAKSFPAYVAMARQRGREVMAAIGANLPDAVIFSLMGDSAPLAYMQHGESLQDTYYALLPAFYDGLLEAMSANAKLVDGYESAYGYKEPQQFQTAYAEIHQKARNFSAMPDHYRDKVQAAFGLMLDYKGKSDYFTPPELQRALRAALTMSDKYVWIYSTKPRFFPLEQVAPAYLDALAAVRSPHLQEGKPIGK